MSDEVLNSSDQLDVESADGCRQIAEWLIESGSPDVAIDWLRRAIEIEPNNCQLHLSLGGAYFELRCWQAAVVTFGAAVRLSPDSTIALYGYGSACANMGRLKEAIASLESARSLQSNALNLNQH